MKRQIYVVDAWVVDANGTFNHLTGYPKQYDSRGYTATETESAIDIAKKRALGDMSEVFGAMCKIDSRQEQTVTVTSADGLQIERRTLGTIADIEAE